MLIEIENLGPVKTAKIDFKPLTIFIGENNTGKTYVANLINYFYSKSNDMNFPGRTYKKIIDFEKSEYSLDFKKFFDGEIIKLKFDLIEAVKEYRDYFNRLMNSKSYVNKLKKNVLNTKNGYSKIINSDFELKAQYESNDLNIDEELIQELEKRQLFINLERISLKNFGFLILFEKKENDRKVEVSIFPRGSNKKIIDFEPESSDIEIYRKINEALNKTIFKYINSIKKPISTYPFPIHRNTLTLDIIQDSINSFIRKYHVVGKETNWRDKEIYSRIPSLPYTWRDFFELVDFTKMISNNRGELLNSVINNKILKEFENDLITGKIFFEEKGKDDYQIKYKMLDSEITIDLLNSSSLVQQLSSFYLYLSLIMGPSDLIIIDEPEANLHPKAQLKFIEIIVKLINTGHWVILTTHTPYIIDHLNNLMYGFDVYEKLNENQKKKFPLERNVLLNPKNVSSYLFEKNGEVKSIISENHIEWDSFGHVTEKLGEIFEKISEYDK